MLQVLGNLGLAVLMLPHASSCFLMLPHASSCFLIQCQGILASIAGIFLASESKCRLQDENKRKTVWWESMQRNGKDVAVTFSHQPSTEETQKHRGAEYS
jgi:hypothetical protein